MKSLLDPNFKYVPSVSTDIRRTFARIRRQQSQNRAAVVLLPKGGESFAKLSDARGAMNQVNLVSALHSRRRNQPV